ncbi:acyl carrier protein [Pseudomonas sp.]|uniref:acyl carrier protein n=1 Tax=Pseudomonas sp. TaxID=306 RepID=UPI0026363E21|nr:acyl carrier protein [Pseudomonas sp.]
MITFEEVSEAIRHEMRGRLASNTVISRDTVLEDLGLSSLQISEIVFTLEERYEFELDAARAADIRTLGGLVDLANEAWQARATTAVVR